MNNPEFDSQLQKEAIKAEINSVAELMYGPEKITDSNINRMFGLEEGNLTSEEINKLRPLFIEAGKMLLQASLEKSSFSTIDEVRQTLKEHMEQYGQFGTHDLVHVVTELAINGKGESEDQKLSNAVPEFIKDKADNKQAVMEEFPAVLWTAIGEQNPIFIDLLKGNKDQVLQTAKGRLKDKEIAALAETFGNMNTEDFKSVCEAYTEILLYLTYRVSKKESGLKGDEVKAWKKSYLADQQEAEEVLNSRLEDFSEGQNQQAETKLEKTAQLFLEQAYSIFQNHKSDNKILYKNFASLAENLVD